MLADVLELYATYLSSVAQKPLVIKGRLNTTSKFDVKVQPIQGKQEVKIYVYVLFVKHCYNVVVVLNHRFYYMLWFKYTGSRYAIYIVCN